MKKLAVSVGLLLIGLWVAALLVFSGLAFKSEFAAAFPQLSLPNTTAELGNSVEIFGCLLSSMAVLLTLLAVVLQGQSLRQQNEQHFMALKVSAFSTRLQYLHAEIERLGNQADKIEPKADAETNSEKKSELYQIMRNSRNKQVRLRDQADSVNDQLEKLFRSLKQIG